MKINAINFKGCYKEEITGENKDRTVMKEFKRAKPFIKLLAHNMPQHDIFVKIENDPCDTILSVDCIDINTKKSHNLTTENEHSLTGHGYYLMSNIFKGLEKYDKKAFDYAAKNFVKKLDYLFLYPQKKASKPSKYICLDCGCVIERKDI